MSRARLQALFWGNRSPKRAQASLRSALSMLRGELAPFGGALIDSDAQVVTLDLKRLNVLRDPADGAFLDGIDLPSGGTEAFETWLRAERAALAGEEAEPAARTTMIPLDTKAPPIPGIGLELVQDPDYGPLPVLAGRVMDGIATQLSDWLGCTIYDYRVKPRNHQGPGPSLILSGLVCQTRAGQVLTLRACRAGDGRRIWTGVVALTEAVDEPSDLTEVSTFVVNAAERLLPLLNAELPPNTPYHILRSLFHEGGGGFGAAAQQLMTHWDHLSQAQAHALLLYLNTFRRGEAWYDRPFVTEAEALPSLRRILSDPGANGLMQSAAGYAAHYLGANEGIAADLIRNAVEINPGLPFAWDHLALWHYHNGRVSEARQASDKAIRLSRMSPLRPLYETTRAMVAFSEAQFEEAGAFGQAALTRAPDLGAALRFTAASLALSGRRDEAHGVALRIRALAPDFELESLRSGEFRLANTFSRDALMKGLQIGGLR